MLKKLLFILIILQCFIFIYSCDDAGIVSVYNDVTLSASHLKRLVQSTEGMYEGFVSFSNSDHGDASYYSIGKFNMSSDGLKIVDSAGNDAKLKFSFQVWDITQAEDVIITIEPPNDYDTIPSTRIMGGTAVAGRDQITANLTMSYKEVLGDVASTYTSSSGKFVLETPTTIEASDHYKGLWFCDMSQQDLLTFDAIPDTAEWYYEGWIKFENSYYSIGKFRNPSAPDHDGAGIYQGNTGNPFPKPGQDWITLNTNPEFNLRYPGTIVFVTLEPANEGPQALLTPFFIILYQKTIPLDAGRGEIINMDNLSVNLPKGTIVITR